MNEPILRESARCVLAWAQKADFKGHDPHDLLGSSYLRGRLDSKLIRLLVLQLGRRLPIDLRGLLRVPQLENAKALALFITGLLDARDAITTDWLPLARSLGGRLLSSSHPNGGWGYPFDWQSRTHFIPSGTPNIVTTAFVGCALVDLFEQEASDGLKAAIENAAEYIIRDIPILETPDGIAFGYAKNDPQIVFNASLLGARFLGRAGKLLGRESFVKTSAQAAKFVVKHQRLDGSWIYGQEPSHGWIDSFHTGFILVALRDLSELLHDSLLLEASMRGFDYYRRTFIDPDFAIRYFDTQRFPIDAHAVGQALVTLSKFGDDALATQVAKRAIDRLYSKDGYFYYQEHRFYTNRIAYLRWSNAWMFRGLCAAIAKDTAG